MKTSPTFRALAIVLALMGLGVIAAALVVVNRPARERDTAAPIEPPVTPVPDWPSTILRLGEPAAIHAPQPLEGSVTSEALGLEVGLNPYDAASVAVDAVVTGPDGREMVVPCFWHVPCEQYFVKAPPERGEGVTDWERFRPLGDGQWRFRVCPALEGEYRYSFRVKVGERVRTAPGGSFPTVTPDRVVLGPVRVRKGTRYFERPDGRAFIPIGENLAWPTEAGSRVYETWLQDLRRAGANCGRLWLVHYFSGTALEWSSSEFNAGYQGVGVYSQESAARVDRIIDAAGRHDIRLMLCFCSFGDQNWDWAKNPYSHWAGGWLSEPAQFFTDERARQAMKNRLRYAAARYGWSPSVWAWELWNEVETSDGYDEQNVFTWHEEMAGYLKAIDPHHHLVTTSYRFTPPSTSCLAYGLPTVDFVQVHSYLAEISQVFSPRVQEVWHFGKPVVIGEYGLYVSPNYFDGDAAGLHVHDGLWAGVFSGAAGTGMTWWWDKYVHARNLYFHFTGISRFLADEELAHARPTQPLVRESSDELFAFALETDDRILAWVGAKREVKWREPGPRVRVTAYQCLTPTAGASLFFNGDRTGDYDVVFYDTFDGSPVSKVAVSGTSDGLSLPVPAFRHDLAVKCDRRMARAATPQPILAETPIHDHFERLARSRSADG